MAFPALSGLSGCDRVPASSAAPPACPPQQLQQKKTSIHEPLGCRKAFSYGFETAAWPPRNLQILRSASNLHRASIHEPLGGPQVLSYGFETASCPPRKLQILRSASSLPPLQNLCSASSLSPSTAPTKKTSIHEPLGCRKVFSYGFETAACPPRNLQILRSASSLPPSSLSPSTAPTKKTSIHEPLGGRKVVSHGFETAACPPRKLQILRSASSLPPSAARACPPQNLRVELCPQYHPPYSVTQSMSLVPFPAASSGLSRSHWPFWL